MTIKTFYDCDRCGHRNRGFAYEVKVDGIPQIDLCGTCFKAGKAWIADDFDEWLRKYNIRKPVGG